MQLSAKAAYSKAARKRLVESRAKLDGMRSTVNQAINTGRLQESAQLDLARDAMEVSFREAECQLSVLQKSGEDEWESRRIDMETAWEKLARSIKNLVVRFTDGTS